MVSLGPEEVALKALTVPTLGPESLPLAYELSQRKLTETRERLGLQGP